MNYRCSHLPKGNGYTLLEMSIVILMLLTLLGAGIMTFKGVDTWKLGRNASETLRVVYSAQRMFLADNPTRLVGSLTAEDLLPYMSGNPESMPTVTSLTDSQLAIKIDVSPPVVTGEGGEIYDPSNNSRDSLWDVGE
jgi:type II secretory pathway pseudopilin PulG